MKIDRKHISDNMLQIIAIFVILVTSGSIIPLICISFYDTMSADDIYYSVETYHRFVETGNIGDVIFAAFEKVGYIYKNWQGTFSSVFFMALQPGIWGAKWYRITGCIMIGALIGSVCYLCITICKHIFNTQVLWGYAFSALVIFLAVQTTPCPVQAFYWYNSAVHYMIPFSCMLLLLACIIKIKKCNFVYQKFFFIAVSCILTLEIGGANYVTGLVAVVVLALILLNVFCEKEKQCNLLLALIPFVVLLLSLYINICAPGNDVRQSVLATCPLGVTQTIKESFYYAIDSIKDYISWLYFTVVLMCLPFMWKMIGQNAYKFRYPLLWGIIMFCIYASSYAPSVYVTHTKGAERVENIVYYIFLFTSFSTILYCVGWLKQHIKIESMKLSSIKIAGVYIVLTIILLGGFLLYYKKWPNYYMTGSAIMAFRSGEIQQYAIETEERNRLLYDENLLEVELPAYTEKPYLLFVTDLSEDSKLNKDATLYYRKESIKIYYE